MSDVSIELVETWDDATVASFCSSAGASHGSDYHKASWLQWKMTESPYGPAIVAIARATGGSVVGAVAFGQWHLTFGQNDIRAGVSYETFVHPAFQRQGIFAKLGRLAEGRCRELGLEILYNFPNHSCKHGFRKMGWLDMGGIRSWVRPQSPMRVALAIVKSDRRALRTFVAEPATSVERDLPTWLTCALPERRPGLLVSVRTGQLLRWRYFTHPNFAYQMFERDEFGCIYRIGARGGLREAQIMDVLPLRPGSAPPCARDLRRLMGHLSRERRFETFSLITTPGTALQSALGRAGFIPVPNNASFMCLPLSYRMQAITRSDQWALTTTDIHTF